jgi:UDP-N-acetyl-D-mannosaminuronic acid transferase (WecB/TagA/CpsF family)
MKPHLPQGDQRDVEWGYFLHRSLASDFSLIFNCISQRFFHPKAVGFPRNIVFDTLRVDNLSLTQATDAWVSHLSSEGGAGGPQIVAFVNARVVNTARRTMKIRRAYNACHLVLAEGECLQTAAKLLKCRLRSISGRHSFLHRTLEIAAQQGTPIFVLAGDDPAACAQAIRRHYPSLQLAGVASIQPSDNRDDHWSSLIQKSGARLVILSMANPDAVTWLAEQHPYLGAWTVVCPGLLAVQSQADTPLLSPPPQVRWWAAQKFYLAVLLQRWLGGVTPEPPQHRGKTGSENTIPQRAYVMALSASQDSLVQDLSAVPALIPVGSQSLLAMHMEQMAAVRCQQVELITDADPIRFREIVNEGERWGLAVTLHLASDASDAFKRLQLMLRMETLRDNSAQPVWLVDASRWIPDGITVPDPSRPSNAIWLDAGGAAPDSTGWAGYAKLDLALLAGLCACPRWDDVGTRLATYLPSEGEGDALPCHHIPTRSAHLQALPGLVSATEMARMGVLDQPNWVKLPESTHIKGEVWRSKTAVVDELAVCEGPAFIGPYCVVAAHAQLGPHVVLGAHVCLENGVEIKHSVVLPGVTVGQGLDITHSLVGLSGISSLSWNSFVPSQALGHLLQPTHTIVKKVGWPERALALMLLMLVPVLSLLPGARAQSPLGRAFRTRFRPKLVTVLWGAHALVGRSSETAALVATDWRDLASDPLGVIAVGDTWGAEGVDEHLIADLYWSVNQNWPQRWSLLRGYLRALGTGKTVSLVSDLTA